MTISTHKDVLHPGFGSALLLAQEEGSLELPDMSCGIARAGTYQRKREWTEALPGESVREVL